MDRTKRLEREVLLSTSRETRRYEPIEDVFRRLGIAATSEQVANFTDLRRRRVPGSRTRRTVHIVDMTPPNMLDAHEQFIDITPKSTRSHRLSSVAESIEEDAEEKQSGEDATRDETGQSPTEKKTGRTPPHPAPPIESSPHALTLWSKRLSNE